MGKLLRTALVGLVGLVILPLLVNFLWAGATDAGWTTGAGGVLTEMADAVAWFVGSQWYVWCLVAVAAFGSGVGLDWLARRFDSGEEERLIGLGHRMADMRDRLVQITHLRQAGDDRWPSEMTLAYTDMLALQRTMQKMGFKVPWLHWDYGDDPSLYLSINVGYLALLSPLALDLHKSEAIVASKRAVDWEPTGPLLRFGGALQRLF